MCRSPFVVIYTRVETAHGSLNIGSTRRRSDRAFAIRTRLVSVSLAGSRGGINAFERVEISAGAGWSGGSRDVGHSAIVFYLCTVFCSSLILVKKYIFLIKNLTFRLDEHIRYLPIS